MSMYKRMKDELTMENITMLERMKSMGVNIWPGTNQTVEEFMITVDKNSHENLRKKFGYSENEKTIKDKDIKSYYFITVNLKGDKEQFKELYKNMEEALHRYKWLRNSIINYEYYTDKGQHPHSHIVVNTHKRRDMIILLLSKFFNVDKNFIDVKKYYGDPTAHLNYVKGIKKTGKEVYTDADTILRDELDIPHYTDNFEKN